MKLDIIVDTQRGDTGKGRECYYQLKNNNYNYVIRTSGGSNVGHTVIHNSKKIVTHTLPMGVLFGVPSIIGPGCFLNVNKFLKEMEDLETQGIQVKNYVMIADTCHIVTEKHIKEDQQDNVIGTTRQGIGPAAREKYARTGIQAKSISELKPYLINILDKMYEKSDVEVLCEGAQGFWLDLHWGDYPYVTSSHCTVGAALINGLPWNAIRKVICIAKPYETYSGFQKVEGNDPIFQKIKMLGNEIGATTGRDRQISFLNAKKLKQAVEVNGATELVFNKMDILKELNTWIITSDGCKVNLKSEDNFKQYMSELFPKLPIRYNYSPEV